MKLPVFVIAAVVVCSSSLPAHAEAYARHLHYSATTRVGSSSVPVAIELDIATLGADKTERVSVHEFAKGGDFGRADVLIDGSGGILETSAQLTFEEEALLDLLALQFENMTGVDRGDRWERAGELRDGRHLTRFVVRATAEGGIVDLDVDRSMEFADGSRGGWRGRVRYDAAGVVPTEIALSGELGEAQLGFSARLTGDSFRR